MTDKSETWKPIPGHEGSYEVSDKGNVRSLDRLVTYKDGRKPRAFPGHPLKAYPHPTGHLFVNLRKGNPKNVHALVLLAFVGPRPQGYDARHLNGTPNDNRLENLEWASRSRNSLDKKWHKLPSNCFITGEDARSIKRRLAAGEDTTAIAHSYGVSRYCIYDIKRGRSHVDA